MRHHRRLGTSLNFTVFLINNTTCNGSGRAANNAFDVKGVKITYVVVLVASGNPDMRRGLNEIIPSLVALSST